MCFSLVVPRGKFALTNQKHYPHLRYDTSSVWNLCAHSSDVVSWGKQSGVMKCRLLSQATIQEASCVFVFTAFECYIKMSHLDIIVYRTDLLVD